MRSKVKEVMDLVELSERKYGSLAKAPYYCDELKITRNIYPEFVAIRSEPVHAHMKEIKHGYEQGIPYIKIARAYHVHPNYIKRFASMYGWTRPIIKGRRRLLLRNQK